MRAARTTRVVYGNGAMLEGNAARQTHVGQEHYLQHAGRKLDGCQEDEARYLLHLLVAMNPVLNPGVNLEQMIVLGCQ